MRCRRQKFSILGAWSPNDFGTLQRLPWPRWYFGNLEGPVLCDCRTELNGTLSQKRKKIQHINLQLSDSTLGKIGAYREAMKAQVGNSIFLWGVEILDTIRNGGGVFRVRVLFIEFNTQLSEFLDHRNICSWPLLTHTLGGVQNVWIFKGYWFGVVC